MLDTSAAGPRILVVATGGTISGRPRSTGETVPTLRAQDLLQTVPQAAAIADITVVDAAHTSSRAMTPQDMCRLAHILQRARADVYDGVVVTHGTDTLEETAYAMSLQVEKGMAVVITGAMRGPEEAGTDGPANLLAALRVASSPQARRLGPVVVIQDQIHLARFVAKTHTTGIGAFASPGFGPVGEVIEGNVHLFAEPACEDYLGLPDAIGGRVELIWVAAGTDGLLVEAATATAQGIVIAGTGGGHVVPSMMDAIRAAVRQGLPVVLTSRTGAGPVLRATYGGPGSEIDLLRAGVLAGGLLSPLKARLRLLVALALHRDPATVFPA